VYLLSATAILLSGLAAPTSTNAASWPQRTVKVIVPVPPGTGIDVITRLFSERLAAHWRQSVIVENMAGADGIVAMREFVSRREDHTLLYGFPGLITMNPLMHEKLPYDPARDLTPIATTSDNFVAIAASEKLKVASLAELVALARSRAGKLNWAATPGTPYFAFTGLQRSAGVDMVQVSYRDFSPALVDLGEGRIDAVAAGVAPLLPHARAGKIRLLAFINRERAPLMPEVPTIAEAGYPDLTFRAVTGFFGGRDMPAGLRERVAADIRKVASDSAIEARLVKLGATLDVGTPADFAAAIEAQRIQVATIAKAVGAKGSK
jgi:tripartite-type tricarboxylate transporter receptor subunit TctC